MTTFLAMLIKPLVAFVFFGVALALARIVMRCIPAGRVKRLLSRPVGRGPARPRRWE